MEKERSKNLKSLSLSKEAIEKAKKQQKKKMCASFSHYVESLILNDK